jgi:hypothetical protein
MKIKFVTGHNCMPSNWKEFPEGMTAKEILILYTENLTEVEANNELLNLVKTSHEDCSLRKYCKKCNDVPYYEYSFNMVIK